MVKVVSLSDDAYHQLKMIKGEKSFSEIIVEIVNSQKGNGASLKKYFGAFKNNEKEWGKIKDQIYEDRKRVKLREVKI